MASRSWKSVWPIAPNVTVRIPAGAGSFIRYRMRAPATLSVGLSHGVVPVWSLGGAGPGGRNLLRIRGPDGGEATHLFASGIALEPGAR